MSAVPLSRVAVHLRPEDNIVVAARPLQAGAELQHNGDTLKLSGRVGMGHKVALRPIKKGEAVYKYGQIIGFASQEIAAGDHVHVHNVSADTFERDRREPRRLGLPLGLRRRHVELDLRQQWKLQFHDEGRSDLRGSYQGHRSARQ